ncbi:ribonuclease P protein component [Corynebacterium glaucum]|uniref:ribonuclease P protein component n=1 Tax=Corynebacterium glaucum TaxID=187491 RepID=UPI0026593729|nr:ribonuclease P protein component [Corynebacterium glaucum]
MLPRPHKLASSDDFRQVMKRGVRAGSSTLVVHLYARDDLVIQGGPRFGLIVSKQVGNAVTRHAVSRKLRETVRGGVDKLERNHDVVVRALPGAATATSAELERDYAKALSKALRKL